MVSMKNCRCVFHMKYVELSQKGWKSCVVAQQKVFSRVLETTFCSTFTYIWKLKSRNANIYTVLYKERRVYHSHMSAYEPFAVWKDFQL